jgi:hypothetical protein
MEMTKLWQKPTKNVEKCTFIVFKFNDHMKKTLKVKSVTPNASILDGMNVLTVKFFVMDFWKEIHQQVIYEGVETLEEAQTIAKW